MAKHFRISSPAPSRPRERLAICESQRVLAALQRSGWTILRQAGSHRTLARTGYPNYVFAFRDSDEIGPRMLARIAKHTGLKPEDL